MTFLRPGIRRLFHLDTWRRRDAARDLRDEMDLHITLRAEQLERGGMTAAEALAEALRLFAVHDTTIQELEHAANDRNRQMRTREQWEAAWQDTRYAARRLVREPGITAFILGTLALGIGINVTAFSVVDRVLLRGPQYVREPGRLVRLYSRVDQPPLGLQTTPWLPYAAFTALRGGMRTIEAIGAYRLGDAMVGSGAASDCRASTPGPRSAAPRAILRTWRSSRGCDAASPSTLRSATLLNCGPRWRQCFRVGRAG
jgi:hypothetical protein